jgi:hypothetical protein
MRRGDRRLENGYWAFEEYGMWPPLPNNGGRFPSEEQFETVELNGIEYQVSVDLSP